MKFSQLQIGDTFITKAWKTREFCKIKPTIKKSKKGCGSCGRKVNVQDVITGEKLFLANHINVTKKDK